jgi:NH3-dependent NAD+ synthetase
MADVIKFPDLAERNDLQVRAELAEQLIKRGIAGGMASALSAEICSDYREFERRLNAINFDFGKTTEAEKQLLENAAFRFGTETKATWLVQRFESELRRAGI